MTPQAQRLRRRMTYEGALLVAARRVQEWKEAKEQGSPAQVGALAGGERRPSPGLVTGPGVYDSAAGAQRPALAPLFSRDSGGWEVWVIWALMLLGTAGYVGLIVWKW